MSETPKIVAYLLKGIWYSAKEVETKRVGDKGAFQDAHPYTAAMLSRRKKYGGDVPEWIDLDGAGQRLLLAEVNRAGRLLRATGPCAKLNIGALGNIVRQLHVHVVARTEDDAAWPGPVWGSGPMQRLARGDRESRLEALRRALAAMPD